MPSSVVQEALGNWLGGHKGEEEMLAVVLSSKKRVHALSHILKPQHAYKDSLYPLVSQLMFV